MILSRLIYASTRSDDMDSESIESILDIAHKENKKLNITGLLCFNQDYFLQAIEGERTRISSLFNKISLDNRHSNVVLLNFSEVSKREFDNWSMGYTPESNLTSSVLLKYSNDTEFKPYNMTGDSALEMMLSLRELVPLA
jgi:hypothetical protein